ncbi:MAG: DUF1127 domain-containing protein [Rhodobacterales bacterium]|jgi:hypothetical protein|nr:DUF1127 domain-containing protein [Rhodobacterales bacterium]
MATIDTNRSFSDVSVGSGFTGMIASLLGTVQAWNDARITRKSLSRLSVRELDDIGLCRGDIDMIANRGVRN